MAGHPHVLRTFRVRLPTAASPALVSRLAAFVALCGALASLSCNDAVTPRARGVAHVALQPQFSRRDAAIYSRLASFGLPVTSVRVVLVRPPSDTVADTTASVAPGVDSIPLDISVKLQSDPEQFDATIILENGTTVLFSGTGPVTGRSTPLPGEPPSVIVPVWVGPGSNATRIVIAPRDTTIWDTKSLALSATAYDVNNSVVSDSAFTTRFEWHVADTTLGTIPLHGGSFTGKGTPGVAIVYVETANLLRDTVRLTLVPPSTAPASISFASQFGIVEKNSTLATSVTVRDSAGGTLTGVPTTYTSRNTGVASVDASGVIAGVAMGQTVVVANVTGTSLNDSLLAVVAMPSGPALFSSIDRFNYPKDTTIVVSVFVDMRNSGKALGSTTVDVMWNPAQLTYVSSANGGSGVAPTVNSSNAGSGTLTLAMADVNGFTGKVELLQITFHTSSTATTGQLQLSARELHATDFTDLLPLTVQVTHPLAIQ